jgi:hypothetical protein
VELKMTVAFEMENLTDGDVLRDLKVDGRYY